MKMWTRKTGSQRRSKIQTVEIAPNFCGQHGSQNFALKTEDGWLVLEPESEAETRQLMSSAAIIFRNYREPRA
jgi:hypothetical protein